MSYTMEDFKRELNRKRFMELTSEELWEFWKVQSLEDRRAMLETMPLEYLREILELLPPGELRERLELLPPEERLAGLTAEQIREYLDRLTAGQPAAARKPRRKR